MTHQCCHDCRARFAAADLEACPDCGGPVTLAAASQVLGYRRHDGGTVPLRAALAAALAPRSGPPEP